MKSSSGITDSGAPGDDFHRWRFVTNHAHVLETIARDPSSRLRDIALAVGITERTVSQIVNDLVAAGYLTKSRDGRRNRYDVHERLPLRHPQHRHHTVGELIRFLEGSPEPGSVEVEPPGR
jgi:DNA-binding transcriptional ArsR family regulator